MLSEDFRKAWPYEFGLVYSVTLSKEGLGTSLQVQNKGTQDFEFQVLLHTYLSVEVGLYYLAPRARDASGNRITDDLAGHLQDPYQQPRIQDVRRQDAERSHTDRNPLRAAYHWRDRPGLPVARPQGTHRGVIC